MFHIIVIVCLAVTGEQCQEFKLSDKNYTDAVTCIRASHAEGTAWQGENTKYTLMGTRCTKDVAKVPEAPSAQ
jgi:hypothetical protein